MKLGTPVICDSVPIITPLLQMILSTEKCAWELLKCKGFFSPRSWCPWSTSYLASFFLSLNNQLVPLSGI